MKLSKIIEILKAEPLTDNIDESLELETACGSDLMSDVLTYTRPGSLLLTGLTTPQLIYTAEINDIFVICFVRNKKPDDFMKKLAISKGIALLSTRFPMFESCGLLYKAGMKGCSEITSGDTKTITAIIL